MNKNKVYIKELEKVGKFTVWLVDGEYIRKDINENFVEYDEHYHLSFIPKNEFWIDQITKPEEHHFFIDHMLNEQWNVDQGKTYDESMKKADAIERKERSKIAELSTKHGTPSSVDLIKKIHKHLYSKFSKSGDISVWIVDGKLVRDNFLVQYADGGHDRVYSFIPKNEIWLEDCLTDHECDFILLHELHERFLMGQGKTYISAHRGATEVEDYYRDHPAELSERIKEEMKKNSAK